MDNDKDSMKDSVWEYLNRELELPHDFEERRKNEKRKPDVNNGYEKGDKK